MKKKIENPLAQPKWLKITAFALYLLSFLWLPKKIRKNVFERRKRKAIAKADKMYKKNGCKYFVVQIERKFITGTRNEMRRYNKRGTKIVKKLTKSHLVNFDYRNAIIYQTTNV